MEVAYTGAALDALNGASDADWATIRDFIEELARSSPPASGRSTINAPDGVWIVGWRVDGATLTVLAAATAATLLAPP